VPRQELAAVRLNESIMVAYFELWGYPGAGKTTVARHLSEQRGLIFAPEARPADDWFADQPIRSALILARNGVSPLRRAATNNPPSHRTLVARAAARQACMAAWHSVPFLMDEGLTHEIWQALYREPALIAQSWWRGCLRRNAAQIIVLDVSNACAQTRIRTKTELGPINRELRDAPIDDERWERATIAYEAISNELKIAARRVSWLRTERANIHEASEAVAGAITDAATRRRPE
jgi:hypothetical protein